MTKGQISEIIRSHEAHSEPHGQASLIILETFLSTDPRELAMCSLSAFRRYVDQSFNDDDVIKAIDFLSYPEIGVLTACALFQDEYGDEF